MECENCDRILKNWRESTEKWIKLCDEINDGWYRRSMFAVAFLSIMYVVFGIILINI